jgi:hypothetical protein
MNTVEDSVTLLVKAAESLTTYRKSLEIWRSAMTDLAIWHSLVTMTEQQEEYDIVTVFTPAVLMAWIIRDHWQPVSIDEDGYEGIDNAVRAYLIDSKLAIDPHHMEEEEDDE